MTSYGDAVREALAPQGLLVLLDVLAETEARLRRLDGRAQAAFAALCATRLMSAHRKLPPEEQRPFSLEWAVHLELVWAVLLATAPNAAPEQVRAALAEFRGGPYDQDGGPDDADDDAAAAAIYAAEALCEPGGKAAYWAASRLSDWAFSRAETIVHSAEVRLVTPEDDIAVYAHPLMQAELRRLLDGLAALEKDGIAANNLLKVRRWFEAG